jgi:hypothetical protein
MGERVRQSHVVATDDTIMPMLSVGKTQSARMWVYVRRSPCLQCFRFHLELWTGRTVSFCTSRADRQRVKATICDQEQKNHLPGFALADDGYLFLDEGPTRKPQADDWQNILI